MIQMFFQLVRLVASQEIKSNQDCLHFLLGKLSCFFDKKNGMEKACQGSCYIFYADKNTLLGEVAPCPCLFFEKIASPFFLSLLRQFNSGVSPLILDKYKPFQLAWGLQVEQEILILRSFLTLKKVHDIFLTRASEGNIFYPSRWTENCTSIQREAVHRLQKIKNVERYFFGDCHSFFNWRMLRPIYFSSPDLTFCGESEHKRVEVQKILSKIKCVLLFWDFKNLTIKAGVNPEIFAFEEFLADVDSCGTALIVFNSQALLQTQSLRENNLLPDYTQDVRTTYRDASNKLRFTSAKVGSRPPASIQECLRKGSFDRLINALARGQHILDQC